MCRCDSYVLSIISCPNSALAMRPPQCDAMRCNAINQSIPLSKNIVISFYHFPNSQTFIGYPLVLSTENLDPLLNRLECLWQTRFLGQTLAKHQLCIELPVLGDAPLRGDLGVDDGVVMLQVGTEALGLEGGPEHDLVHGGGLLGPVVELVGVGGVGLLLLADGGAVVEEEDLLSYVSILLLLLYPA